MASSYTASVIWKRDDAVFTDNQYSRAHLWQFDGGLEVPASASPHIVPLPLSVEANLDPEEAFVAALASCHMLFFLSLAAQKGWLIETYRDNAEGILDKGADGQLMMTEVTLRPEVTFGGRLPSSEAFVQLHHQSHQKCFIARSVKSQVNCQPQMRQNSDATK